MTLNTALWLCGTLLQTALAVIMLVRGAWRAFLFFFLYTVFAVAAETGRFFVLQNVAQYYSRVYWTTEALYVVLGFLAILEVFRVVFKNFYTVWWFKFLMPTVAGIMLVVAILMAILRPPVHAPLVLTAILSLEITVRCLQVGMFCLIFLLARIFNLYYRQYAFGIAAGFGIAAIGILVTMVLRAGEGPVHIKILTFLPVLSYDVAVLVWLTSFIRTETTDPFRDFQHLFTPDLFLQRLAQYRERVRRISRP